MKIKKYFSLFFWLAFTVKIANSAIMRDSEWAIDTANEYMTKLKLFNETNLIKASLFKAIQEANENLFLEILPNIEDINARDYNYMSFLDMAITCYIRTGNEKHLNILKKILAHPNLKINILEDNYSPLIKVCLTRIFPFEEDQQIKNQRKKISIKLLLTAGVDPNIGANCLGENFFYYVNNHEIVKQAYEEYLNEKISKELIDQPLQYLPNELSKLIAEYLIETEAVDELIKRKQQFEIEIEKSQNKNSKKRKR